MDHAFELAYNLVDEAAGRIRDQHYGTTRILFHNHGKIALTSVHERTPDGGHRLVLLATDDDGQLAAVEATAPDLHTPPLGRIVKVRAGELTFHAVPRTWSFRATTGGHTYTLTAEDHDPLWSTVIDDETPTDYDDLDDAVNDLLDHHAHTAA